jgi:diguanylate cyclase (GGDEF)-like protein/PAS domain S-box-containing protein
MTTAPYRGYLAANVPLVVLIFLFPDYHTFLWGSMGLGASAAVIYGTVKNRPRYKTPWILIGMALGTFISGDITYDILTRYLHEANPFPSIADAFYLATYPLLAAGLLGLVRSRRKEPDIGPLLDALVVASAGVLLSWIYLIQPYVHSHDMSFFVKSVSIAYPVGDLLLVCILARLLAGGGGRNTAIRFLSVGAIGMLTADCVYGWIQLHGNWKVGGPTDLGWVAFYVLWGAAALHPSMRELTEQQPRRPRNLSVWALLALSAATLAGPMLLVWRSAVVGQAKDAGMIAGVSAVSFVLVMARLTGLARAQAASAGREFALREFAGRLVGASEVNDVFDAAAVAVEAMIGTSTRACLLTETGGSTERVLVSVPAGFEGLHATVIDAKRPAPTEVTFQEAFPPDVRSGERWSSILVSDRGVQRYRILVSHDGPLPLEVVSIIDALAAQLVVAIERVELAADLHKRMGEARFRSLIQNASDMIVVAQPDLPWASVAPSIEVVLGYSREVVKTLDVSKLLHPDDVDQAEILVETMLRGTRSGPIRTDWRLRHADGRWIQMEVIASDLSSDPDVRGVVLNLRDVSDQRLLEEQLLHRAFHDGLTDLANRALFADRVDRALGRMQRRGTSVSVLLIDLDDFKFVNDALGHAGGDDLLVQVGVRLRGSLREDDTAARLGGDEFAVCAEFDPTGESDLTALATRIIGIFDEPFSLQGTAMTVRASVGISTAGDHTLTRADMLREADFALYAAKNSGKGTFRFFKPNLHEEALARVERQADLEKAVEAGQLRLYYQPIVRLFDGAITGMEALVRWQHPVDGLLPPLDFIPLAERSGVILALGDWVLDQACADLSHWQRSWRAAYGTTPCVSVNVSARQLESGNFVETVDSALNRHGIDPSTLTLEITESCLAEDTEEMRSCVFQLNDRGIALSMDDFGTGYSSLSRLQRFPMRNLKIDRSFVLEAGTKSGLALLDAIVSMARSLGLSIVAEGIETEEQAKALEALGCEEGQGYLYWRPMTAAAVDELFEAASKSHAAAIAPR